MTKYKKAILIFLLVSTGTFYFLLLTIALEGKFYEIWPTLYKCLKLIFFISVLMIFEQIYKNRNK
jgi:hypothetical protein